MSMRKLTWRAVVSAAAICVVAALPSWADTNITSNVTLTEDTDWSDLGKVTIAAGVTVNLNGHNLTASDIAGSGTITDTMVDLTEPDSGGNHVWCTNTMYGTSVAANLFNNNFSRNASDDTRRLIMPTSSLPLEVDYDFLSPRVVDSYKLYCGPKAGSRNPSAWALYGSNDKENWTELHSVSGENLSGDNSAVVTRSYTFDNSTAYRYYRFKGIACRDSSYFEMVQLEYFCRGVLHLNVPAGKTVTNSTVSLTGTLRLIKEGDGTFVASKTQSYSGGTVVAAGTLKPTLIGTSNPYGANDSQVEVKSGATLDVNGKGSFYNYRIVLDGGSIRNVGTDFGTGAQFANVRLESDSSLGATNSFGIIGSNYARTTLDLGGHALTVNIASGKLFELVNTDVKNGTVDVASGGSLRTGISGTAKANNNNVATNADFRINAALYLYAPLSVRNYEALFDGNNNAGTAALNVYGTFKPSAHDYFYGPTMQDGSTIDLSARTSPLPRVSSCTSGLTTLQFVNDATVTIDVGDRNVEIGDCLVSWAEGAAPDLSVGFTLCTNGVAVADKTLVVKDDESGHGIYVKNALEPAFAQWVGGEWKFFMENGDEYEGEWTGGVTSDMQVRFSSAAAYEAACGLSVTPAAFVMTGFEGALNVTSDLTRISFLFDEGATIDANGGCVKIPASMAGGTKAFTVTNSTEHVGTLEVEVAEEATATNTVMALTGNLKFLKSGTGTFVADKTDQTYSGGTVVAAGTLMPTQDGAYKQSNRTYYRYQYGATDSQVEVKSGATLDVNGKGSFYYYRIVLDGGSIRNVGTDFGTGAQFANIRLESDSSIGATNSFGIIGSNYTETSLDLGGYTLTVNIASGKLFELVNTDVKNGTVDVTSGGSLRTGISGTAQANNSNVATNVDFRINAALYLYAPLSVRNYEALFDGNNNAGTAALNVYGTFKPSAHNYFYGPTMQDGSTIDLSARTSALPRVSSCTSGLTTLQFADNATVKIKLGGRKVSHKTPIVSWTTAPDNLAGLNFVCGDEERRFAIIKKDDGLYVFKGFIVIVR